MTNINLDQFLGGSYIGAQGIQGITGSQGIQGTGGQGNLGNQGIQGIQGTTGSQGIQGTGVQGSLGNQGIQGVTGSQGVIGALKPWTIITANHLAVNGDRLIANTTAGSFTVTLPDGPTTGSYLQITDGGNWSVNNLLIDRNGATIEGIADTLFIDIPQTTIEFIYDGTTWQFTSTTGARGATGPQGPQGSQGIAGSEGFGSQGITGSQGIQGITGSGSQGITGSQGIQGITGSQGIQGITGSGSQGITGSQGIQGRQGIQGTIGSGSQGITGSQGIQGITGSGSQGIQGTGGGNAIAITNDIASITTRYVSFVDAISGTVTGLGVSSTKLYFNPNTGTLNATEFNSLSDMSLKENMETITNPLEAIKNINGFKFNWKDTKAKSMGVSAQNIEEIFPEIVNNDIHKSVNYNGLIAVLIEAIKQLDDKIEAISRK